MLRVPVEERGQVWRVRESVSHVGARSGSRSRRTGIEVELDVGIFLALCAVVVRTAADPTSEVSIVPCHALSLFAVVSAPRWSAYTWTLLSSNVAEGVCGLSTTLQPMATAKAKTTDVKKPKTFCSRTSVECIAVGVWRWWVDW